MDDKNTNGIDPLFILQAITNHANDYAYIYDFIQNTYTLSDSLAYEFGLEKQGTDWESCWVQCIQTCDRDYLQKSLQQGIAVRQTKLRLEYQAIDMQGRLIRLSDQMTLQYHEQTGHPQLLIGILRDLARGSAVDSVTGLLTHDECERQFLKHQTKNPERWGTVMLLGIDDFTSLNTLNDHAFGDMVLHRTACDILELLPESMSMFRFDGDQFLICAEGHRKNSIYDIYQTIRIYAAEFHEINGISYGFTISAGVAGYPEDGEMWTEVEKAASIALKLAKRQGRDRCVSFTPKMLKERMYEQTLRSGLKHSVDTGFQGFHVMYQPVCHASGLHIKGAEALLRFEPSSGIPVSPLDFIPVLEQTGLIHQVGLWVLEQAIRTCKEWVRYIDDFVMNVNVSYLQLRRPDFCDQMEELLEKYELDISHLTLELTESYFITDAPNIDRSIKRLQDLHVQVAMDDFGTGYSSLARLSHLNVDMVKVDRSFIHALHKHKYNYDFVDSVIRLCHNVGMKVCIEGVETREEQACVCLLSADYIQGFYISKPLSQEAFCSRFLLDLRVNEELVVPPNPELLRSQLCGNRNVLFDMMESSPFAISFWVRGMQNMASNSRLRDLFGVGEAVDFQESFFDFSPEFQPDGQRSHEKAAEILERAFSGERINLFWLHRSQSGEDIPAEVQLVRIPYLNDYIVVSYTRDMREQRRMEEKIERFNVRLKALLDATPLCLNLWNRNYENIMCNYEAVKLFELHDEQEYTEHFFELSPLYQPDGLPSGDKAMSKIKEAFETGRTQFFWMHYDLHGHEIPAEITLVRIDYLDDDGGALVAGYTRDMRQQIAAEEENKRFNVRLRAILDATPLCLNLWNDRFENTMCNQEAVHLFELANEQLYTEHFFELSPPLQPDGQASSEKAMAKIREAFEIGRTQFFWMHCNLQGEEIPAEITLVRIDALGDGGAPLVAGFTRDIRTQLAAQNAQKQSAERIRAVLDSMPLACILWTMDREVLDCNQGAVSMFGADSKQDVMQNFDAFNPVLQPDGANSIQKKHEKFEETIALGFSIFEWVYHSRQGKAIPCEITLVKVTLAEEEFMVAYNRDLRELYQTLEFNDRLAKLAYHDLLTGCASRVRFMERLEESFHSDKECTSSLVIFDIDYFKSINDNYGHAVGDTVLKRVVKCTEALLQEGCLLGRFGGDEFTIQCRSLSRIQLQDMLDQLVNRMSSLSFWHEGKEFSVTVSAGASFKAAEDCTPQQVLERADKALYEAKNRGRNCSVIL